MKKIIYSALTVMLMVSCSTAEIPLVEVPDGVTVTYDKDIQPIVFNSCLTCHSSVNPAAGLTLETYVQVRTSAENGNLIQRINDAASPMPLSGLLPADQRALFDKWVTDGYLEN